VQAVLASRLKTHLKLTALCVAWHCNDESGHAWMSKGTLASECSATERNVTRNVQELLAMGVLKQSRRGGGRITSQYEFDFGTLAAVGTVTPDAGVRGEAAPQASAEARTPANRPLTPASGHPRRGRPLPLTPASGERDERKPKASLSSKAAPVSAKPDTHAAVRTPPTARSSTVTSTPAPQKTKQPPTGEQPKAKRQPSIYPWLDDEQALSRRGVELGLQPLPDALAAGMKLTAYMVEAIKRAGKAGERQVRRA
jgi:hypothetical protein